MFADLCRVVLSLVSVVVSALLLTGVYYITYDLVPGRGGLVVVYMLFFMLLLLMSVLHSIYSICMCAKKMGNDTRMVLYPDSASTTEDD